MATSSITENFTVEGDEQAAIFANAIEDSYQESLTRVEKPSGFHRVHGKKAMRDIIETWKKAYEC